MGLVYVTTFTIKDQPNVGKYTIHGWYGLGDVFFWSDCYGLPKICSKICWREKNHVSSQKESRDEPVWGGELVSVPTIFGELPMSLRMDRYCEHLAGRAGESCSSNGGWNGTTGWRFHIFSIFTPTWVVNLRWVVGENFRNELEFRVNIYRCWFQGFSIFTPTWGNDPI